MLTWADYRTQIRRSILNDEDSNTWGDEVLLDLCGWALDAFCAHTAAASAVTFEPAQELELPENLYSDVETTGVLYYRRESSAPVVIPSARLFDFADTKEISYTIWGNTLTLSADPPTDISLVLRYFALWDHPSADESEIPIPAWSRGAVAHLVGAYAQTSTGIQSANIDRWKDRRDSGNPEDNALRIQQQHLLKLYEAEIGRYPRQMREGLYQKLLA